MVNQVVDTARMVEAQTRAAVADVPDRFRAGMDALLGRNEPGVGLTPKDTLYSRGTMRLYRYRPVTDEVYRVPVVFVMSLVSKSYILDLVPGQSFVEYLLQRGYDVYMIDWGVPRPEDHTLRLENYVLEMMPRCVEQIQRTTGERDISLLGYCMGGTFGLMYAAAFPDSGLKNLITVASPVDYNGMGLLRQWADPRWFNVDRVVDAYGNIPAQMMMGSLEFLRPLDRPMSYIRLFDNFQDATYVYNWRIRSNWARDQIPFPGEAYRQMTKELMWGNKLMTGELMLDGHRIDLQRIYCSVLNAMAQYDHIAPYDSTRPLLAAISSDDKQELTVRGGHVSLIAGRNAMLRLWPTVNEWLSTRST